jgi:hypothetical protein
MTTLVLVTRSSAVANSVLKAKCMVYKSVVSSSGMPQHVLLAAMVAAKSSKNSPNSALITSENNILDVIN